MNDHTKYMKRCLELAKNGLGMVYPNPMVGSVLVHNGLIIGEGWHQKAGCSHAEVKAIDSVKNKALLPEATLYVNLEPCSHHGRTPPCADLIISSGIKKVVIGAADTNKKVGGKGIKRLRENGVEVVIHVLEKEARELNKRFFTFHEKKRPYVILKWAQSKDGYIFPDATRVEKGIPYWISNSYSLQRVHQWRSEEASILVGTRTVRQDNPKLNIRDFAGNSILRIAIDRKLELSSSLNFFDGSSETIIFNELKDEKIERLHYVQLDFSKDLVAQMMRHLHKIEIQSLIVEGGAYTLNAFIGSNLWDEARIFQGGQYFENGLKAPVINADQIYEEHLGKDLLRIYKNNEK
jgi:diaminohydroxyphosphoribosylaminopyrimidine deaminase/5-amino-6-(5-phosphoribosylamino)uracil reductase